jgi:hypothetical protein
VTLVPACDATAADWVVARWSATFDGRLVPSGFESCARIFHPAQRDGRDVSWQEIAEAFGTVAHARMDLGPLTRRRLDHYYSPVPGVFDEPPGTQWLPTRLVPAVVAVLRRHTTTPADCVYGIWHGYGGFPERLRSAPELVLPGRTYYLFTGDLDHAIGVEEPSGYDGHWRPALWWPKDHAWFLGSDTDLCATYVAGSKALVAELVASELEAFEVSPETGFAHRGDDVNPASS